MKPRLPASVATYALSLSLLLCSACTTSRDGHTYSAVPKEYVFEYWVGELAAHRYDRLKIEVDLRVLAGSDMTNCVPPRVVCEYSDPSLAERGRGILAEESVFHGSRQHQGMTTAVPTCLKVVFSGQGQDVCVNVSDGGFAFAANVAGTSFHNAQFAKFLGFLLQMARMPSVADAIRDGDDMLYQALYRPVSVTPGPGMLERKRPFYIVRPLSTDTDCNGDVGR